jgi:hypothetical protein
VTAAQRPLTEHERSNILNGVLKEELNKTVAYTGSTSGNFTVLRPWHPTLRKRGTTWAEVAREAWLWDPKIIFVYSLFTFVTCGLYGWFWLYQTFKKPKIYTVVVDEYGNYRWTQNPIPRVQKVERYILLAVMALFALWVIGIMTGSDIAWRLSGLE